MNLLIQDTKGENVSHDQTRKIGNNQDLKVDIDLTENVTNDQKVTIKGKEEVTISGERQKSVAGNETVDITGARKVKVGSNNGQNVKMARKLIVGAAMNEETTGNMQIRAADATFEITGAVTTQSEAMIGIDVTNGAEQTIGVDKFEHAAKDRLIDVHENYDETVGSNMTMESSALFMDGADNTSHWEVSAAITGKAPSIHMDAKNKIELKCGGSTITITETDVEIKASSYDLSGSTDIIAITKLIKHN
jgi:type VI secretion system secreted protein VgrG